MMYQRHVTYRTKTGSESATRKCSKSDSRAELKVIFQFICNLEYYARMLQTSNT
ncbi:hypothetical protein Mapa_001316 [Marchantia paleacea]|nr:hypothetical protein Mapa_001316 [Marchantia paleacea]